MSRETLQFWTPDLKSQPLLFSLNQWPKPLKVHHHLLPSSLLFLLPLSPFPCLVLAWACPGMGSPESLPLPGPKVEAGWMVGGTGQEEGSISQSLPLFFSSNLSHPSYHISSSVSFQRSPYEQRRLRVWACTERVKLLDRPELFTGIKNLVPR